MHVPNRKKNILSAQYWDGRVAEWYSGRPTKLCVLITFIGFIFVM